jgi:TolB-like protein
VLIFARGAARCGHESLAMVDLVRRARQVGRQPPASHIERFLPQIKVRGCGRPKQATTCPLICLKNRLPMAPSIVPEATDVPGAAEVQAALDRILASEGFRTSPQLGAFLRFVVEAALGGRAASLKGYTIGVEALGRDPDFDPQIDPIVRVEATRLRRALERYYLGAGSDDPVVMDLPRGSYVPTFRRRPGAPEPPASPPPSAVRTPIGAGQRRRRLALAVSAMLIIAAAVSAALLLRRADQAASTGTTEATATRLPPGNGMPTIAIDALRVTGTPGARSISAAGLTDKIRDAFSRFDTFNVAAEPSASRGGSAPITQPRPDYQLTGSIEYAAAATYVRFQLIDPANGTIVWSRTFERPSDASDADAAEEPIVAALADLLLQGYGFIRSRDHARHLVSPAGDPRYRCVLEATDSFRSFDPASHRRARACLEHLTSIDPSFQIGFEFLAAVYTREYQYPLDADARAGEQAALDRALRAARRAVELAPESARAYQMLMIVLYSRRDVAAAFAAGDKAMALNRYDVVTIAEYGGRLILTGEIERGMAMMRQAGENSGGVRTPWHHFFLFLGSYLGGDMQEATFQAKQITADDYPQGLVAKAIVESKAGHPEQARRVLDRLLELQPAWRTDARRLLAKSIFDAAAVDRLMRDLAAAGLPGAS